MCRGFYSILVLALLAVSCSHQEEAKKEVLNPGFHQQKATTELIESGEKKFFLDSISAPKLEYVQVLHDSTGREILSFLNTHNKTIYIYNYQDTSFVRKIPIGVNADAAEKLDPMGYMITSTDTIFVYNKRNIELLRMDVNGTIHKRISLINNNNIRKTRWFLKYPQYYPQGSNPIIKVDKDLVFPGQSFESLRDSLLSQFQFASYINTNTDSVQFYHDYPDSLYGHNYNWSGEKFTEVYVDWNQDKQLLVFSFPVSHDLYIAKPKDGHYEKVNGASNHSEKISSIPFDLKDLTVQKLTRHVLENDEYGPVRYDAYRKVYYRFFRHGVKQYSESSQWGDKELSIILFDQDFHYLGEKNIGLLKNWYIQNSFVNKEGLHIEYIPKTLDEDHLVYRIFTTNKKG